LTAHDAKEHGHKSPLTIALVVLVIVAAAFVVGYLIAVATLP
jgi:hypothetical protein